MTRTSTISFCSLLLAAALTVGIATTAQAGCAPRCSDPVYHAPPVYRAPPTTNSVSTEPVPTNPVAANPAPPPTPIPVRPRPIIVGNPRQGGEGGDPCIAGGSCTIQGGVSGPGTPGIGGSGASGGDGSGASSGAGNGSICSFARDPYCKTD